MTCGVALRSAFDNQCVLCIFFFFFVLNESLPCESLETCKRDLIFIPHSPFFLSDSKGGEKPCGWSSLATVHYSKLDFWHSSSVLCFFFFHPIPCPSVLSSMHHHPALLSPTSCNPTNNFFFISFSLAPRLFLPLKCLLWEIVCKGPPFLSTASSEVRLFPDIYCTV